MNVCLNSANMWDSSSFHQFAETNDFRRNHDVHLVGTQISMEIPEQQVLETKVAVGKTRSSFSVKWMRARSVAQSEHTLSFGAHLQSGNNTRAGKEAQDHGRDRRVPPV